MRLIHLADYGGPYAGSFIPMLAAVGREATRRGWDFQLIFSEVARDRPWLSLLKDWPVTFAPKGDAAYDTIRQAIDGPTVLHSHFTGFDFPTARLARELPEVATYWHTHSKLVEGAKAQVKNRIRYAWFGRGVSENLCVTPEIAQQVRARFGRRASYLPNAIDTERFSLATAQERQTARHELGLDSAPVFLHLGWDWHRKGGDLMLDALAAVPEARVVTVGADPAVVASHPAADRVLVVPPTNDVRPLQAAADVFLSSSRAEGMPYSLLEGLSRGVPAVVTPINGHRLVADSAPGCHVAAAVDADALAESMRRALKGEDDPAELHRWVVSNADVKAWARDLCDRYGRGV